MQRLPDPDLRPPRKEPIDLRLGHETLCVVRLDTAPVENADVLPRCCSEIAFRAFADEPVAIIREPRRGGLSCADRPHRFVRNYDSCKLRFREWCNAVCKLFDDRHVCA